MVLRRGQHHDWLELRNGIGDFRDGFLKVIKEIGIVMHGGVHRPLHESAFMRFGFLRIPKSGGTGRWACRPALMGRGRKASGGSSGKKQCLAAGHHRITMKTQRKRCFSLWVRILDLPKAAVNKAKSF
ncbi:hypothetical protein M0412_13440 [Agrobacterium sp. O3.4]|uniref:hypothetical protein n=1 Tax=Rhizobium/Agrobacterium group TaxID=227290 RepID=UPI0022B71FAA|nr:MULTISPECIES: hypothetical protein [Rhizobium/Agrobacterium group]MCZ7468684.1 hypothetical protein [Rhizobium rhizogenes]